jgi:uncharacterized protein (DUF58 family)
MVALGLLLLILLWVVVEYYVYSELVDGQIRVSLSFSPDRVARGEQAELLLRVEHVGRLPIPWLSFYVELPAHLACPASAYGVLEGRLAIPYRGGIVRHYPVSPARRGLYRFSQPVRVEFSDPLGLVLRRVAVRPRAELIAYPWPRDSAVAAPIPRALMGAVERFALLEDPTATRGVRDYQPQDPLRRVHWPQTARTGRLMAREYATAVETHLYLVLNIATHVPHWANVDHERLEAVIEVAAGLAMAACRQAVPVGLVVNGVAFEATPITRLAPSASLHHLARLIDVLARLAAYPAESAEALVQAALGLPPDSTVLFVTATVPEGLRLPLRKLARHTPTVVVAIAPEGEAVAAPPDVRVVRLPLAAPPESPGRQVGL